MANAALAQEIKVNPKGVNVNSQGATTVFLTYGGLGNYRAAESNWCGELIPATPDLGFKCAPETIYGALPARYDQSRRSGDWRDGALQSSTCAQTVNRAFDSGFRSAR